jgi:hypothetical protein
MDPKVQEQIRLRAYQIWESEGRPYGRDLANWLDAEREVGSANEKSAPPHKKRAAKKTAASAVKKGTRRSRTRTVN